MCDFISELSSSVDERKAKEIIFKVMIESKTFEQLDLSDDFWSQFNVQDKMLKKQVGLFEIEIIDNPNINNNHFKPKRIL